MGSSPAVQITLRLPSDLHAAVKRLAANRGTSMSQVALEALADEVAREEDARLTAEFDAFGADEDSSVEMYFAAQSEVVLRDE